MTDIKALEHPTLKVPYEILNKKFRAAQKTIDRETSHIRLEAVELEARLKVSGMARRGDIIEMFSGVQEKLKALKRKSDEAIREELEANKIMKVRTEHLKGYEDKQSGAAGTAAAHWRKQRMDRFLVEYLLRSEYYATAMKLARHAEIENLTNLDVFLVAREVEESLKGRDTSKALAWCHDNKSKLRKLQSTFEFNLRTQEFIELIRSGHRIEAIRHSKKYFISADDATQTLMKDIQRVMGLLAFPLQPLKPGSMHPYHDLLNESRWDNLVTQFRQENCRLYQLSNRPIFCLALQAGLSALKTPHCYRENKDTRNSECPVCSKTLNILAKPLPYAHCAQSRLVCFISGESLNENNPPLMLPNGHVYGETALVSMAMDRHGTVECPRTKEIYELKDCEKVYVM